MNKDRLIVLTLVLMISLSFVQFNNVDSAGITSEETFAVTPLPFWDYIGNINHNSYDDTVDFGSESISWSKRKIDIGGESGSGINYQFNLTIYNTTGSNGNNTIYLGACSLESIKFYEDDSITLLDFWIQERNINYYSFWIEIKDNLDSNVSIYVYYSDEYVISLSNGDNTFIFFDDFENGNLNKWDTTTACSISTARVSNGVYSVYLASAAILRVSMPSSLTHGLMIHSDINNDDSNKGVWGRFASSDDDQTTYSIMDEGSTSPIYYYDGSYNLWSSTSDIYNDDTWYKQFVGIDQDITDPDMRLWFNNDYQGEENQHDITGIDFSPQNVEAVLFLTSGSYVGWLDEIFVRKWIIVEPIINDVHSEIEILDDYETARADISLLKYKNHKVEFMFSIEDGEQAELNFSIRDLSKDTIALYYYSELDKFTFNGEEISVSGIDTFKVLFEYQYSRNTFTIDIAKDDRTRIGSFETYTGIPKSSDILSIGANSTGLSIFYYLTGTVDYTSKWSNPDNWENLLDYEIDDSYTFNVDTINPDYSSISTFVSQFAFLRTHFVMSWDDTDEPQLTYKQAIGSNLSITIFYPNGTEYVKVDFFQYIQKTSPSYDCYVYTGFALYYNQVQMETETKNIARVDFIELIDWRIGIWRSQQDKLCFGFNISTIYSNEEFNNWRFTDYDFLSLQANISISYWGKDYDTGSPLDITLGTDEYIHFTFDGFELAQQQLGVEQVHFSSNWWDNIPIVRDIINGFLFVGNLIISGLISGFGIIVAGLVGLFQPLFTVLSDAITGGLSAIAGGIWGLFTGALSAIQSAIATVASGIWSLFSSIIASILTGITDLIAGLVEWIVEALENFIPIFIAWFDPIIEAIIDVLVSLFNFIGNALGIPTLGTDIATAFGMFVTVVGSLLEFLGNIIIISVSAIAEVVYYISKYGGTALWFITTFIVVDIAIVAIDMDIPQIKDKFASYMNMIMQMFEVMFKVFNAVVQFIGGIIP